MAVDLECCHTTCETLETAPTHTEVAKLAYDIQRTANPERSFATVTTCPSRPSISLSLATSLHKRIFIKALENTARVKGSKPYMKYNQTHFLPPLPNRDVACAYGRLCLPHAVWPGEGGRTFLHTNKTEHLQCHLA